MDSGIDIFEHSKKSLLIVHSHFHPLVEQLSRTASFGLAGANLDLAKIPSPPAI